MLSHSSRHTPRPSEDRGAALVELALVLPVLFVVIFAIIELGWAFGGLLDVRQAARETARLVAVNYPATPGLLEDGQSAALVEVACDRLSTPEGSSITLTLDAALPDPDRRSVGRSATVVVTREHKTLTGFLDFALGGRELTSSVLVRLEQRATWNTTSTYTGECGQ